MPSDIQYTTLCKKCQTKAATIFRQKIPLTNEAWYRIIEIEREHTSRRSAPKVKLSEISVQVSSLGAVISVYCGFARSKWYRIQHCTKQKTPSKSSQSLPSGSRIRPPNTYYVPVPMHSDCYYSIFCRKLSSRRYTKNPVCPLTNRMDLSIIKIERAYRQTVAPMSNKVKN